MHDDETTHDETEAEDHTIEEHAARAGTPRWALACAKVAHGWGEGQRMSAADYDKRVDAAITAPVG